MHQQSRVVDRKVFTYLSVLMLLSVLVACAGTTSRYLHTSDGKAPRCLSKARESMPPGHIMGFGRSEKSEVDARNSAFADIQRQISEALLTSIHITRSQLRTGNQVDVTEMVEMESSVLLEELWLKPSCEACKYTDEKSSSRHKRREIWEYYLLVPFSRADLRSLSEQVRERIESRIQSLNNQLAEAEWAVREGDFLHSIHMLSNLYINNTQKWSLSDNDLSETTILALTELIQGVSFTVDTVFFSDCVYTIEVRSSNHEGTPLRGVPIQTTVTKGSAMLLRSSTTTDPTGIADFVLLPNDLKSIRFEVRMYLDDILDEITEVVSQRKMLRNRLIQRNGTASIGLVIEPGRVIDRFNAQISLRPDWCESGFFKIKWELVDLEATLSVSSSSVLSEQIIVYVNSLQINEFVYCEDGDGVQLDYLTPAKGDLVSFSIPMDAYSGALYKHIQEARFSGIPSIKLLFTLEINSECEWADRSVHISTYVPPP